MCVAAGVTAGIVVGVVLGIVVGPIVGVAAGVVVAVAVAVAVRRGALGVATRAVGGRAVPEGALPRVENMVDGLGATFGVRPPQLVLVDDPVPNACSFGDARTGVLVLTSGMVASMDLLELEGVVAHELTHLKIGDAEVSAVAVTVLRPIIATSMGVRLLRRLVGDGRELRADALAVHTVRYPPGLQRALERMATSRSMPSGHTPVAPGRTATSWLWIDPAGAGAGAVGGLDDAAVRAAVLAEL